MRCLEVIQNKKENWREEAETTLQRRVIQQRKIYNVVLPNHQPVSHDDRSNVDLKLMNEAWEALSTQNSL